MLGDIQQLADGLWWIEGEMPQDNDRDPDIANALVYRREDRLYVIDTGSGPVMRTSLLRLLRAQGAIGALTLLNSHTHLDHVGNNDVVHGIPADARFHYLSTRGLHTLDGAAQVSRFARHFLMMSAYFDPLAAFQVRRLPRLSSRLKFRMAATLRDAMAAFIGQERAYRLIMSIVFRKFAPVRASRQTAQPIESLPRRELRIGAARWTGWALGDDDVWVLEDRGHSPDHLLFYLPVPHLLHAGDTTFDMFRIFPDVKGDTVRETLRKCLAMAEAGDVQILTDGHHHRVYQGRSDITAFLGGLLADDEQFRATLAALLRQRPGLMIPGLYQELVAMRDAPAVRRYLEREFPHTPPTLQAVILLTLLEMGALPRGQPRHKRFYLPDVAQSISAAEAHTIPDYARDP